jgi:hypothetical protein
VLTPTELDQIKAALDMLSPDDVVRKVYPDIIELLKTFTKESANNYIPGNTTYGGTGSYIRRSLESPKYEDNVILCNNKNFIEDTPKTGGSLS